MIGKVIVTAGPTREMIDPVRYISNRSSGKQGFEIAKSMRDLGFETHLVSGPVRIDSPQEIYITNVITADEMMSAVSKILPCDIIICTAAVSDWKPVQFFDRKMGKDDIKSIELKRNVDIITSVANSKSRPKLVIGFAAETDNHLENAMQKIKNKGCDWIILNNVDGPDGAMESEYNQLTIIKKTGEMVVLERNRKSVLAYQLCKIISDDFINIKNENTH